VFVPAPPEPRVPAGRPLIVTADAAVLDDLLRLAAAAGVEPEVAADAIAARRGWSAAPVVLVGSDVAADLATAALPRRARVLLVGPDAGGLAGYQHAVALGAEDVLGLPGAEPVIVQRIGDAVEGDTAAAVFGVIGGRGGAGATTFAVALALAGRRRGLRTMLVDADPLGGGIDLAVGAERATGLRWHDLAATSGRVSAAALHDALVHAHDLTMLSCGRVDEPRLSAPAMHAALQAGCRAHDLVVIDVPRHVDAATRVALERIDVLFLVVPADVRAAAAAGRVTATTSLLARSTRVVVRGPAPSGLTARAIADSLGLPLAGELRPEPRIDLALDRGDPPGARRRGPLASLCARQLDEAGLVATRPVAA
jgi:secretion/DNA translocation related CpaE-like protein